MLAAVCICQARSCGCVCVHLSWFLVLVVDLTILLGTVDFVSIACVMVYSGIFVVALGNQRV